MVRKDTRFGNAILASGDSCLEHQLQKDVAVKKERPGNRDLRLHARLEPIARGKDDVFTAHHSGLAEAVQRSVFGCDFVTQRQWDRVPASWPLGRRPVLWPVDGVTSPSLNSFRLAELPFGMAGARFRFISMPLLGNPEWVHSGPAALSPQWVLGVRKNRPGFRAVMS